MHKSLSRDAWNTSCDFSSQQPNMDQQRFWLCSAETLSCPFFYFCAFSFHIIHQRGGSSHLRLWCSSLKTCLPTEKPIVLRCPIFIRIVTMVASVESFSLFSSRLSWGWGGLKRVQSTLRNYLYPEATGSKAGNVRSPVLGLKWVKKYPHLKTLFCPNCFVRNGFEPMTSPTVYRRGQGN